MHSIAQQQNENMRAAKHEYRKASEGATEKGRAEAGVLEDLQGQNYQKNAQSGEARNKAAEHRLLEHQHAQQRADVSSALMSSSKSSSGAQQEQKETKSSSAQRDAFSASIPDDWNLYDFHITHSPGMTTCDHGEPVKEAECEHAVTLLRRRFGGPVIPDIAVGEGGRCGDGAWGEVPMGCSVRTGHYDSNGQHSYDKAWRPYYKGGDPPEGYYSYADCIGQQYQLVCRSEASMSGAAGKPVHLLNVEDGDLFFADPGAMACPDGVMFSGTSLDCERVGLTLFRAYATSSWPMQFDLGTTECATATTFPVGCSMRVGAEGDNTNNYRAYYNRAYMKPANFEAYADGTCVPQSFMPVCSMPGYPGRIKYRLAAGNNPKENGSCKEIAALTGRAWRPITNSHHCGLAAQEIKTENTEPKIEPEEFRNKILTEPKMDGVDDNEANCKRDRCLPHTYIRDRPGGCYCSGTTGQCHFNNGGFDRDEPKAWHAIGYVPLCFLNDDTLPAGAAAATATNAKYLVTAGSPVGVAVYRGAAAVVPDDGPGAPAKCVHPGIRFFLRCCSDRATHVPMSAYGCDDKTEDDNGVTCARCRGPFYDDTNGDQFLTSSDAQNTEASGTVTFPWTSMGPGHTLHTAKAYCEAQTFEGTNLRLCTDDDLFDGRGVPENDDCGFHGRHIWTQTMCESESVGKVSLRQSEAPLTGNFEVEGKLTIGEKENNYVTQFTLERGNPNSFDVIFPHVLPRSRRFEMVFTQLPDNGAEVFIPFEEANLYYITTAAGYSSDAPITCPYYNSMNLGCAALRKGVVSVVGPNQVLKFEQKASVRTMPGALSESFDYPPQCTNREQKPANVRCCSWNGFQRLDDASADTVKFSVRLDMRLYAGQRESKGCSGLRGRSYNDAIEICEYFGFTLCTEVEVKGGFSQDTGCGFDASRIWTNTACDPAELPWYLNDVDANPVPRNEMIFLADAHLTCKRAESGVDHAFYAKTDYVDISAYTPEGPNKSYAAGALNEALSKCLQDESCCYVNAAGYSQSAEQFIRSYVVRPSYMRLECTFTYGPFGDETYMVSFAKARCFDYISEVTYLARADGKQVPAGTSRVTGLVTAASARALPLEGWGQWAYAATKCWADPALSMEVYANHMCDGMTYFSKVNKEGSRAAFGGYPVRPGPNVGSCVDTCALESYFEIARTVSAHGTRYVSFCMGSEQMSRRLEQWERIGGAEGSGNCDAEAAGDPDGQWSWVFQKVGNPDEKFEELTTTTTPEPDLGVPGPVLWKFTRMTKMPGFSGGCSYDEGAVEVLKSPFFEMQFGLHWEDAVDADTGNMDFRTAVAFCKVLYDCAYVVEETTEGGSGPEEDQCNLLRMSTTNGPEEETALETDPKQVNGAWNEVNALKYAPVDVPGERIVGLPKSVMLPWETVAEVVDDAGNVKLEDKETKCLKRDIRNKDGPPEVRHRYTNSDFEDNNKASCLRAFRICRSERMIADPAGMRCGLMKKEIDVKLATGHHPYLSATLQPYIRTGSVLNEHCLVYDSLGEAFHACVGKPGCAYIYDQLCHSALRGSPTKTVWSDDDQALKDRLRVDAGIHWYVCPRSVKMEVPDPELSQVIDVNEFTDCALKVEPETHKLILHSAWSMCSTQADVVIGSGGGGGGRFLRLGPCGDLASNRTAVSGDTVLGGDFGKESGFFDKFAADTTLVPDGSETGGQTTAKDFKVSLQTCAKACEFYKSSTDSEKSCSAFAIHKSGFKNGDMLERDVSSLSAVDSDNCDERYAYSGFGVHYRGCQDFADTGVDDTSGEITRQQCDYWSAHTTYVATPFNGLDKFRSIEEGAVPTGKDHNYCRNPDPGTEHEKIWCYYTDGGVTKQGDCRPKPSGAECCTLFRKDACDIFEGGSAMRLPTAPDQMLFEMGSGFPIGMALDALYYRQGAKELQDVPWQMMYEHVRHTVHWTPYGPEHPAGPPRTGPAELPAVDPDNGFLRLQPPDPEVVFPQWGPHPEALNSGGGYNYSDVGDDVLHNLLEDRITDADHRTGKSAHEAWPPWNKCRRRSGNNLGVMELVGPANANPIIRYAADGKAGKKVGTDNTKTGFVQKDEKAYEWSSRTQTTYNGATIHMHQQVEIRGSLIRQRLDNVAMSKGLNDDHIERDDYGDVVSKVDEIDRRIAYWHKDRRRTFAFRRRDTSNPSQLGWSGNPTRRRDSIDIGTDAYTRRRRYWWGEGDWSYDTWGKDHTGAGWAPLNSPPESDHKFSVDDSEGNWIAAATCSHSEWEERGYTAHVYEFVPPVPIYGMRIHNRGDCCQERLNYAKVYVQLDSVNIGGYDNVADEYVGGNANRGRNRDEFVVDDRYQQNVPDSRKHLSDMTVDGEGGREDIGAVPASGVVVLFNLKRQERIRRIYIVPPHRQQYITICGLQFFRWTSVVEEIDPSVWQASEFPTADDQDQYGIVGREGGSGYTQNRRRAGEIQWRGRVGLPLFYARGQSTRWPNYCSHTEHIWQVCHKGWAKGERDGEYLHAEFEGHHGGRCLACGTEKGTGRRRGSLAFGSEGESIDDESYSTFPSVRYRENVWDNGDEGPGLCESSRYDLGQKAFLKPKKLGDASFYAGFDGGRETFYTAAAKMLPEAQSVNQTGAAAGTQYMNVWTRASWWKRRAWWQVTLTPDALNGDTYKNGVSVDSVRIWNRDETADWWSRRRRTSLGDRLSFGSITIWEAKNGAVAGSGLFYDQNNRLPAYEIFGHAKPEDDLEGLDASDQKQHVAWKSQNYGDVGGIGQISSRGTVVKVDRTNVGRLRITQAYRPDHCLHDQWDEANRNRLWDAGERDAAVYANEEHSRRRHYTVCTKDTYYMTICGIEIFKPVEIPQSPR
ncbi:unnamed protein product [Amoebophrya sp. A120]|nr:unnamed protein product [Amoebophrya sp. A120]|eukprot:GSA120T00015475001.1